MFRIAGIERESIVDGEGWRYVIFLQGCKHNCKGCHNPETHDFNGGNEVTEDFILNDLEKCNSAMLMDITLSGGDPFFQARNIIPLCAKLKERGYNIWAYTGFKFDEFIKFIDGKKCHAEVNQDMIDLLNYIDVVVDGPFIESKRTISSEYKYRGSTNQRLIDVKKTLKDKQIRIYKVEV